MSATGLSDVRVENDVYLTPPELCEAIVRTCKRTPRTILEPSAGNGDIITALKEQHSYRHYDISAIEIDGMLADSLRGKGVKVIDSDFLMYAGPDKFDLIIASHVIEHVGDDLGCLNQAFEVYIFHIDVN